MRAPFALAVDTSNGRFFYSNPAPNELSGAESEQPPCKQAIVRRYKTEGEREINGRAACTQTVVRRRICRGVNLIMSHWARLKAKLIDQLLGERARERGGVRGEQLTGL